MEMRPTTKSASLLLRKTQIVIYLKKNFKTAMGCEPSSVEHTHQCSMWFSVITSGHTQCRLLNYFFHSHHYVDMYKSFLFNFFPCFTYHILEISLTLGFLVMRFNVLFASRSVTCLVWFQKRHFYVGVITIITCINVFVWFWITLSSVMKFVS